MTTTEGALGFFTTDTDLVVRTWDGWLARVTGIPAGEACGQPLTKLVPDLDGRGLLSRLRNVLDAGVIAVLAPAFHRYFLPCPPPAGSRRFDRMQQRVTIAPVRDQERILGVLVTIEDVTARREREAELAEQLASSSESVRYQAAQGLSGNGGPEDPGPLLHVVGDDSWRVRHAAVDGLSRYGGTEAVTALLRAMHDQHRNLSVLNSAIQVLVQSNVDTLESLLEFLKDPDEHLRGYAANVLGEQRRTRAVPALRAALADSSANVRYAAIEALGKIGAVEAVDDLAAIAETRDFFLAFPALEALGQIGEPSVAIRLVPLLGDSMLCAPAAQALGQIGDDTVAAPLAVSLNVPTAPAAIIAGALLGLHDRFERTYRGGLLIAQAVASAIEPPGIQNLLDALEGASPPEVRALAVVLGWLQGPAVEKALTRLLGHPTARAKVLEALVCQGKKVTELLLEQLREGDYETRQAAAIALGRISDSRAVPALIRALEAEEGLAVVAAGALAKIGDRQAFEALLSLLGNPDAAVRQAAISALNSLGHPDMPARMRQLLQDANELVRESAVRIVGYFGYAECIDLLFALCQDPCENVRRVAVEHLPYVEDDRVVPTLAQVMLQATEVVRAAAARAFGQVEDTRVLPYLMAALEDRDPWVRYYAARSIGRQGFPEAVASLSRLAQADPAGHVRVAAIESLGQIGGARAVAVLASLTESLNADLVQAAAAALGQIAHPDARPPLLAMLHLPDTERRLAALKGLGVGGGPGLVGAIHWVAASDRDPAVVQAAIDALARIGTPEAIALLFTLATSATHREACVAALAQLDEAKIGGIARGLSHGLVAVRCAAVDALARMKRPHASDLLRGALQDPEPAVRYAAVTALGHLGSRAAEKQLVALAHTDPDAGVRRAAHAILQR